MERSCRSTRSSSRLPDADVAPLVAPYSDGALATKEKPAVASGSLWLRGRDSNPNFLIQSQASYH